MIYFASKVVHAPKWRALRDAGLPVNSTWIDESKKGETKDWQDLWGRCIAEASQADAMVLYAEPGEVLKGALVELGAALLAGVRVYYAGPADLLTALNHEGVTSCQDLDDAVTRASLTGPGRRYQASVATDTDPQ